MNSFKIPLILISLLIFNPLFSATTNEDINNYLNENNICSEEESDDEVLNDDDFSENSDFDTSFAVFLKDYVTMRKEFQNYWHYVESDYQNVEQDLIDKFFDDQHQIAYSINGIIEPKTYFNDIPMADIDKLYDFFDKKFTFYQWFNLNIERKKLRNKNIVQKFIDKGCPSDINRIFYIQRLLTYYSYNKTLLCILPNNIEEKDSFLKIDIKYPDDSILVKFYQNQETALSSIRKKLSPLLKDLKNNNNLQTCFSAKKHGAKPCSESCLLHAFKEIKNEYLFQYYNLCFGRFALLEKMFGADQIRQIIKSISFYEKEIQIIDISEELIKELDSKPKNKTTNKNANTKKKKKKKQKILTPKPLSSVNIEKHTPLKKSKPLSTSPYKIKLKDGTLIDCPSSTIQETKKESIDDIENQPNGQKKKKGIISSIKEKFNNSKKTAETIVQVAQNPKEEIQVLMNRLTNLMNNQAHLQKQLTYEEEKRQKIEQEKEDMQKKLENILHDYTELKIQKDLFESQSNEQNLKLENLKKETEEAMKYAQTINKLRGNSAEQVKRLRRDTLNLASRTNELIAHNQQLSFMLHQNYVANVHQSELLRWIVFEREQLLIENNALKHELFSLRKKSADNEKLE
jgi:hypothetical protein